ncbi:hypothetical protein Daesc_002626 [Daldinia eschscholtzii]|uniref:Uncharacterized protein n=1 Tax=Daldinia eschscholtzii TaxID=292717 RepID=A0AAX6MR60_9PEZI
MVQAWGNSVGSNMAALGRMLPQPGIYGESYTVFYIKTSHLMPGVGNSRYGNLELASSPKAVDRQHSKNNQEATKEDPKKDK